MIRAYNIVVDLLSCTVQENLTMVLELVYSDDERRVAQSTSKQIWNILYKDIVAPDIMQTEGGEDDLLEEGNPDDDDDTDDTMDSSDSARFEREDIVHKTPLVVSGIRVMMSGIPRTRWLGIPVR